METCFLGFFDLDVSLLLTSSEVELMETDDVLFCLGDGTKILLTSSEVELMETLIFLVNKKKNELLLISSDVELMET